MKDIRGYLIISASIIIGSLIVSFFIYKSNNPKNHCYNKVYKNLSSALPRETYDPITKHTYKSTKEDIEADAAKTAIFECGLHPRRK